MSLTLIPCKKCCFALFCDEDCMKISHDEYHDVECQIMDIARVISYTSITVLEVQAALKIRKMCRSWNELILASQSFGIDRLKTHSINDIYDVDRKFALLSFKDDVHFVHGTMYNASFDCGVILHYLESVKSFFPQSREERKERMNAIARILMFLTTYGNYTRVPSAVSIVIQGRTVLHNKPNVGWFGFTGKLKHACSPNLYVAGLNNTVALIAIQPIKRGTELTISYMGHYLDHPFYKTIQRENMYKLYGIVCDCYICSGEWVMKYDYPLSGVQKKNLRKLNLNHMKAFFNPREVPDVYHKLCKTLAYLHNVPFSKEYRVVYGMFKKCVLAVQHAECSNKIVDYYPQGELNIDNYFNI